MLVANSLSIEAESIILLVILVSWAKLGMTAGG